MAISIDFLANVRDFLHGTKDVQAGLDDVAESLDDVAREGDGAGERLERSLRDVQEQTEKTGRGFRAMALEVESESARAGSELGRNLEHGATRAQQAIAETKNEALQNASETFSSFDGTAQSFVDGIQGTFGGLVASLGAISPALIPIGVAGGLAIGLISSGLQDADQNTEEFKADVAELIGQLLEAGSTGHRSFSQIADDIEKLATETDDSKTNLKDLQDIAKTLGVPLRDVVYAYEQGGDALDSIIAKNDELREAESARAALEETNAQSSLGSLSDLVTSSGHYADRLEGINSTLTSQRSKLDAAAQAARLAAEAGLTTWQLKADLIDQVDQAYDDAAGSASNYINKENGLLDVTNYIKGMKAREKALREYQQTLAEAELTPEARKFLESQGQDSAAAFLAGYKNATPKQRAELERIWTEAGKQDSGTYTQALATSFDTDVPGPTVVPKIDTAELDRQLRDYGASHPTLNVQVRLKDPVGRSIR